MTGSAVLREVDRSVLRWGGVAGIAGGLLFIGVFALVIIFVGPEPSGAEGPIRRFPEIRTARTVENGLYLAVLALWAALSVTLGAHLRPAHPAPARFGSALHLLGLGVLAAGARTSSASGCPTSTTRPARPTRTGRPSRSRGRRRRACLTRCCWPG